jgi:hypothetical protein
VLPRGDASHKAIHEAVQCGRCDDDVAIVGGVHVGCEGMARTEGEQPRVITAETQLEHGKQRGRHRDDAV